MTRSGAEPERTTAEEREALRVFAQRLLSGDFREHQQIVARQPEELVLAVLADLARAEAQAERYREALEGADIEANVARIHADRHAEPACQRCTRYFDIVMPEAYRRSKLEEAPDAQSRGG